MFRPLSLYLCAVMAINLFCTTAANATAPKTQLETKEVDLFNKALNRPTKLKLWYQTDNTQCHTKVCLASQQELDRVAVISHGAFGSPREMNWLGYALASQGWVVVGVAHYGESWVYGPEKIDPSSAGRFWQRPQDVSFAIDSLETEQLFDKPLQTNRVIMLGHSAGGFTSLAMSGASLEAGKSESYCATAASQTDKGCYYRRGNKQPSKSNKQLAQIGLLQAQMKDPRIAAVIALDPALGHAVSEQSLKRILVPTLVIGAVENDFLPFNAHAQYYADHIPKAELVGIADRAGHFVFIDACDSDRAVFGVPLCKDRDGVERSSIQKAVLGHVFRFIYQNGLG